MTERRVEANGLTFAVTDVGEGPAVLLLHGWPDSRHLWRHQVTALSDAGYRVIAPDLRGFGESDKPDDVGAYGMRQLLGDVAGILDALEVDNVHVVGHDWGAALTWYAAQAMPDRVRSMVAVSVGHPAATVPRRQHELSWYMLWFLFPGAAERGLPADDWAFYRRWLWDGATVDDDPDLARQIADLSRPGALSAALGWYRANIDPARFLSRGRREGQSVSCPVMGVWGSEDPTLGEEQMTGSAELVDGPWRYERLDGVGHWVPAHAAERLSELLLDFLPRE